MWNRKIILRYSLRRFGENSDILYSKFLFGVERKAPQDKRIEMTADRKKNRSVLFVR